MKKLVLIPAVLLAASPVFPGEALTVVMWDVADGAVFQTWGGDGRVVIDAGRVSRRG